MNDSGDWKRKMEETWAEVHVNWRNFGLEVKAARALLGMTRDDLGKATHLAPATITRIETGEGSRTAPNVGRGIQATLESCGIEFPEGTSSVCVALRLKPGERLSQV